MTISHIVIVVPASTWEKTLEFYDATIKPLGYTRIRNYPGIVGYGVGSAPVDFWLFKETETRKVTTGFHIALDAADRAQVAVFHETALKTGGTDHGAPGIRENISPKYYAAFVLDPNGINLEAVTLNE